MSTLDLIIKWAQEDLLDWQSDAVRRMLTQEELTKEDKRDKGHGSIFFTRS